MKTLSNFLLGVVTIVVFTVTVAASEVTALNDFVAGESAVAADVNANFTAVKTAVDDNNVRLNAVRTDVDDNITRIDALENPGTDLVSSISLTVGRPDGYLSGNATFHFLLSNKTATDCDISTAFTSNQWQIGPNTKGGFIIIPTYTAQALPRITTVIFPIFTTTYTIVDRLATVNFSANDYVQVTLLRSETSGADTCNSSDVMVRGVIITYSGGRREFVAPGQLRIN